MKQICIAGNIGKAAELRTTQSGDKLASFSVAVSGFKRDDPAMWFDCTWFGARGEKVAQYIRKGEKITVTGELGTREHNEKTYLTVRVSDVTLQGGRSGAVGGSGAASQQNTTADDLNDDVLF